jgi:hypothetical protein
LEAVLDTVPVEWILKSRVAPAINRDFHEVNESEAQSIAFGNWLSYGLWTYDEQNRKEPDHFLFADHPFLKTSGFPLVSCS